MILSRFVRQHLRTFIAQISRARLDTLRELAEADRLRPVIDRTYPLADAAEAIRQLAAGRVRGKVVIQVRDG